LTTKNLLDRLAASHGQFEDERGLTVAKFRESLVMIYRYVETVSLSLMLLLLGASSAWTASDTCFDCHMVVKGPSNKFVNDIHYKNGISCVHCHGGDPQEDSDLAMRADRGFKPYPLRAGQSDFCGTCHSDAAYMRKYKPSQRVDQLALYRKSVHGVQFAQGNTAAANCIDCHGIHNIRAVNDPLSFVHPSHLAETCGAFGCHDAVLKESAHAKASKIVKGMVCSWCHPTHGPA
jgi:hypothetical protein